MIKLENLIQNVVMIGLAALLFYPILGVTYLMIKAA